MQRKSNRLWYLLDAIGFRLIVLGDLLHNAGQDLRNWSGKRWMIRPAIPIEFCRCGKCANCHWEPCRCADIRNHETTQRPARQLGVK